MKVSLKTRKGKNGDALYLDIAHNNKRKKEYLKLYLTGDKQADKETLKVAENIRIKRLAELQKVESLDIEPDKYLFKVITEVQTTKKAESTKENYKKTLFHIKEFFQNDIKIKKVTAEQLEKFKQYLLTKVSQNTTKLYLTVLKTVFNYAIKKEYLTKNPFIKVDPVKTTETIREYLTADEIKTIEQTETGATETKRAFLFACYTGLRFSDIKNLKYEDIKDDIVQIKMIKTSSLIRIPLNQQSKKYLYTDNKILPLPQTNVFNLPTPISCNKALKRLFKKAGIKKNKISFHLSRHTFATLGLKSGINIHMVSKLLGHKDLSTTEIYAKLLDSAKIEAIAKLDNL